MQVELKGKNIKTCLIAKLYRYCSRNKQHVKQVQNGKTLTWQIYSHVVLLFPGEGKTTSQLYQTTETKSWLLVGWLDFLYK